MENFKLIQLITKVQNKNKKSMMELIEKFNPLLYKFTYHLGYDDAYQDLLVGFIELINNLNLGNLKNTGDCFLLSYIKNSVYRNYISLSKIKCKFKNTHILMCQLSDFQTQAIVENAGCMKDSYSQITLQDINSILTEKEFDIINFIFFYGYDVQQISNKMGISRQAVNQTKKRALDKLRMHYT